MSHDQLVAELISARNELASVKIAAIAALKFGEDTDFFDEACDDGKEKIDALNEALGRDFDPPDAGDLRLRLNFNDKRIPARLQRWINETNEQEDTDVDEVIDMLKEHIISVELFKYR